MSKVPTLAFNRARVTIAVVFPIQGVTVSLGRYETCDFEPFGEIIVRVISKTGDAFKQFWAGSCWRRRKIPSWLIFIFKRVNIYQVKFTKHVNSNYQIFCASASMVCNR